MKADKSKEITRLFMDGSRIDEAVRRGARNALLEHKREGLPVPMWIDGKTVWVPPEDIEIPGDETSS